MLRKKTFDNHFHPVVRSICLWWSPIIPRFVFLLSVLPSKEIKCKSLDGTMRKVCLLTAYLTFFASFLIQAKSHRYVGKAKPDAYVTGTGLLSSNHVSLLCRFMNTAKSDVKLRQKWSRRRFDSDGITWNNWCKPSHPSKFGKRRSHDPYHCGQHPCRKWIWEPSAAGELLNTNISQYIFVVAEKARLKQFAKRRGRMYWLHWLHWLIGFSLFWKN